MRQAPQRRLVKMIEVRVRQENKIDRREMADLYTCAFDAFQKEEPVRKIWIDENVEIVELNEERRVPDPGDGHLAGFESGKLRTFVLAFAPGQQRFPDHFVEKCARLEGARRSEFFECPGQTLLLAAGSMNTGVFAFHRA